MSFAEARVPEMNGNLVAMASHGNDKNLTVRFYSEPVYQEFKSQLEGRAIYETVDFIHISYPGAKSDIIKRVQMTDEPNAPSHPHRFPQQWQNFQNQKEQVPDGTPLEMCKFIPPHRVMEFKAQRIHTAEQLASLPDSIIQTLGMGAARERELAKAYLKEDDSVAKLSSVMAENNVLKNDLEALKEQMAAFSEEMKTKRGPGRPRKDDE